MALKLENFNRGAEAIAAAAKGNGKGGGFAPNIAWKVGEEKFVQFLLPIDLSPTVSVHEWIDCGTKKVGNKEITDYGFFIDRRDPVIGEDTDPLAEKGSVPRKRVMSVAIELEAEIASNGKGRNRPKGFSVMTSTYDRKTDDGDEEVTQPVIGYVSQASGNFFQTLVSYNEAGEFEGTVFKIKRTDDKTYVFTPYFDLPVDYTNLVENIEGVSYLSRDEDTWGEVEPKLGEADSPEDFAFIAAVAILERRLNELADFDEYKRKTAHIEEVVDKFAGDGKGKGKKQERPARQSQRGSRAKDEDDSGNEDGGSARPAKSKARFNEILAAAGKKTADDDE